MKRKVLVTLLALLFVNLTFASPVDIETAKSIGERFVRNNMQSLRGSQNSKHVLTLSDDNGNACLYIFNIEDKGYYIVSADDRAKPVLAYSDEGAIDVNNMHPSLTYYLDHYRNAISYAIENNLKADASVKEEWNLMRTRGIVTERNLGKSVEPLVDLKWNQIYPYNYYCPTELGGPGDHAYVGCAADVMAMIMKYWNYPDKGVGSHSYVPEGYPEQSANFGETTYEWDNMPAQLYSFSPEKEIKAVALLMYHCGVSIDMKYGPMASSGYSELVPAAMKNYFKYTSKMTHLYREQHDLEEWKALLIENLDRGLPVFYAGSSQVSGGHAFVCDGYTEDAYFHFNWGWSGVGNGNFAIDALNPEGADYNINQRAIFDLLPDYAHKCMPKVPVIETKVKSVYSYKGVVNVNVPTLSDLDETLEKIDEVVILRNNKQVYSAKDVTPGSVVTFEDEVEEYGTYTYSAYAVSNGIKGRRAEVFMSYGTTCSWNIEASTTSYQGWKDACLQILCDDNVFDEIRVTNATPVNLLVQMPEGEVSFVWKAPKTKISSMTLNIKNSDGEMVYEFSGSSTDLQEGVLYSGNNSCDNCIAPKNLKAEFTEQDGKSGVIISWDKTNTQYYKVYRSTDNENYTEIAKIESSENKYFDANDINGIYYYQVTSYNEDCESMPAATPDSDSDYVMAEVMSLQENYLKARVYPNPASRQLNVYAEGMTNVTIYNVVGQKIIDCDVHDTNEIVLDLDAINEGVYMLKISTREGAITQKINIKK